ncbi:MAG: bifunctional adenosylcobinamide kinase/adenosylcobinamide-phosphate guanylyltransferase [Methylococcales bacterium]|jgi:adenosylcobinamide kinase/adenosylcobinamide-phosphate guanylyltransferase|nr:bifunctional adenosylcobinamide kinase/adenosylcobinamide-phosphate guanylyltransferase [Methylococcaceae bacterium]
MIELVLGGARSGKSRYAEQQAANSGKQVIYLATAEAGDAEMQARILHHQQTRPKHWPTIEEPIQLAKSIKSQDKENVCLLVDCLTLWLSNILFNRQGELQQAVFQQETQALYEALSNFSGQLILVSNEVGLGVIPMHKMTRRFVDEAGFLHQQIALLSHRVVLMTAGLPQILK